MTIWDDRILEYTRDNEGASVGELETQETIRVSNAQISRRCKKLAKRNLLRPLGNGVYQITERGDRYLDGKISTYEDEPDEIRDSDENDNGAASPSNAGEI